MNTTGYCVSNDGTFPRVYNCSESNVCDPANDEFSLKDFVIVTTNPNCSRGELCIRPLPEECIQPTTGTCKKISAFVEEGGECRKDEDCIETGDRSIRKYLLILFLLFEIILISLYLI